VPRGLTAPLLPANEQALQKLHVVVRILAGLPFSLFPAFSCPRDLTVTAVPHTTVERLPRSQTLLLNPVDAFLASPSCS
jgi:hypothetical protein